ncbi:hypothetical protein CRM22_009321 [Opisthorchis felineus]|uniref:Ig-like domain-containing protein n=1 Tax=Opisthorchis felineus TaxID=147828 RepID=A0A4S2L7F9_OPIFE|nr:hypothetical protein CRM22_009321 [Opisthorchis felineus]
MSPVPSMLHIKMTRTVPKVSPKNKENQNRRIFCYINPIDDKLEDLIRMFVRLALYTIGGNKLDRSEVQEKALGAKTLCSTFSEPLQSIVETTSIILAGRFRQRFGKTRLQLRDGYFTAADQKFNATILVTAVYKNDTFVEDLITIGTFFIPTGKPVNKPGCLDAFYKNSKYMFFLKKVGTPAGYYAMTHNPQLFTEKLAYSIYARRCSSCYAPKIEPISNLEMKPGEQLTITCVAMGKPLPEVTWIKNGKSLNLVDKSVRVEEIKISDEQTESILEISSLIRIDSGEYKCLAHNSLGEASVSFSLQVSQPDKPEQVSMDTELIECPEEHRDYCLNGGQCYMLKSDRNVLQCRCSQQYFGDRCHFHVGGLLAYAEAGDAGLHSMFKEISHEIITHLSWSLWGSVLLVVGMLLYLIYTQHHLKSHFNKAKRSRLTGGRNRQPPSAQGSNLLLGSRAVSCTEFEDRSGLHVNNAVTLPVPAGRMCASEQNIPVDSRSQNR